MDGQMMIDVIAIGIIVTIVVILFLWVKGTFDAQKAGSTLHHYVPRNSVKTIDTFQGTGKYKNGKKIRVDSSKNVEHIENIYLGDYTGVRIPNQDDLVIKTDFDMR